MASCPWLKTLDASVAAVNQGGKRKERVLHVYLEPWHADVGGIPRAAGQRTGDDAARTHNLNLANWIPDLFLTRVEADAEWSLFDPKNPYRIGDPDLYGERFRSRLRGGGEEGTGFANREGARVVRPHDADLGAETGNGWITFSKTNPTVPATRPVPRRAREVHLSNLCTEILQVTSQDESAVCNLGSVNLGRHMMTASDGSISFDFDKLANHGPHRGPAAGPGYRSELLPGRHHEGVQHALAARGLGPHGLAGCLLPDAVGVRVHRRPDSFPAGFPSRFISMR